MAFLIPNIWESSDIYILTFCNLISFHLFQRYTLYDFNSISFYAYSLFCDLAYGLYWWILHDHSGKNMCCVCCVIDRAIQVFLSTEHFVYLFYHWENYWYLNFSYKISYFSFLLRWIYFFVHFEFLWLGVYTFMILMSSWWPCFLL